ncbi:MAG: hypothetical protein AAF721_03605 [Myxococcota bacterium]
MGFRVWLLPRADVIRALVWVNPDDCPCGLSCMPSGVPNVNICSELQ